MKKITIDNKEYTFEFTIEASLYDECTLSIMDTFVKGGMVKGAAEDEDLENAMSNLLETIANMPTKALTLFYAGLLEHHGAEGDKTVRSKSDTLNKFGLTTMDCAAVCKDLKIKEEIVEENGEIVIKEEYLDEYIYGLRYEELIAPMIKTIQLMEKEISLLKSRIDLLENK